MTSDRAELPTLYHRGKSGGVYSWRVWTEGADVVTEYGLVDGEKQVARKAATPKNVGRSNATTAEEQAVLEARSLWQNKRDRKYFESVEEAMGELIRPMLAHDFEKRRERNVAYPAYVQPKLDGVRALAFWDGSRVEVMSRSGKSWRALGTVEHIAAALEGLLPRRLLFDGEVYAHGETFQETTRLVKKYREGLSERLLLHVYDVVDRDELGMPFSERYERFLQPLSLELGGQPLEAVRTEVVEAEEEVYELHREFVALGYEGAILRTADGVYQYGARSFDLLKVKSFLDAEFEIVGHKDGVGKFAGAVIWVCRLPDGRTFDVVPRGSMEERRRWYLEGERHHGSLLNVRYFEVSEDGVPRFPVGAGIRAPEDMS
jgi:ATP-dependent DNA ligase